MTIKLKIHGVAVGIDCPEEIGGWICHDYSRYLSDQEEKPRLNFFLSLAEKDRREFSGAVASLYHDDYIVFDLPGLRVVDFFGRALSLHNLKQKRVEIFCSTPDYLYEIFYLAFESLLGEELDRAGYHRLHCLALERNGRATILLLPPGAGKTTLALKFLAASDIKVLAEDMVVFKRGWFYGLQFRWGVRHNIGELSGRLMKREKNFDKTLIDSGRLNLADKAVCGKLILGRRVLGTDSRIESVFKTKAFLPLFKSMVLGLELQQSMAYFLLRRSKDFFIKAGIGLGRLSALLGVLHGNDVYRFDLGDDIEKNFITLKDFLKK